MNRQRFAKLKPFVIKTNLALTFRWALDVREAKGPQYHKGHVALRARGQRRGPLPLGRAAVHRVLARAQPEGVHPRGEPRE